MRIDEAKERYPIGTWVRFYNGGHTVISPVIGYQSQPVKAEILTELCPVHSDSVIDYRLPEDVDGN